MITNHRRVVWAEELGIDMKKLRREHPDHWDQIMMKKRIGQAAEKYWAAERMLARMDSPAPVETPVERVKTPRKPTRVKRYEFTEAQLEIARRSLDAGGRV
jgi:hypothetical protein